METDPILKKTLVTMAAMVGACVVFVGTLSLAAVLVTTHAVNGGASPESESSSVPADKVDAPHGAGKLPSSPASKSRAGI